MKINTIEEALDDFRQGKFVIVVYDEDRWNMGDRVGLIMPTDKMKFSVTKRK